MNAAPFAQTYLTGSPVQPTVTERDTFSAWIQAEWETIRDMVRFTFRDVEPERMLAHYDATGELLISAAHNEPAPWLSKLQNVRFRAIHDWHHLQASAGFDLAGEYAAFKQAKSTAPQCIHWMLYSEIVLQAAACIHTGAFQEQKLVRS